MKSVWRKATMGIVALVVFLSMFAFSASALNYGDTEVIEYYTLTAFDAGDVNQDGTVDVRDLVCMHAYLSDPSTALSVRNGDLDFNGRVDEADLVLLRKLLLGVVRYVTP